MTLHESGLSFTSCNLARSRLFADCRFTMTPTFPCLRPQMWVKPRNVNVSGLPTPRFCRSSACEPSEFEQSRLLGVQSQAELLHASPEFLEEAFGLPFTGAVAVSVLRSVPVQRIRQWTTIGVSGYRPRLVTTFAA